MSPLHPSSRGAAAQQSLSCLHDGPHRALVGWGAAVFVGIPAQHPTQASQAPHARDSARHGHSPCPGGLQQEGLCCPTISRSLPPPTAETAAALQALHPDGAAPPARELAALPLAPEMAPELVARCLRDFPAETAPGPSGLRSGHLHEACVAGQSEPLLHHFAAVVGLLVRRLFLPRSWRGRGWWLYPSLKVATAP